MKALILAGGSGTRLRPVTKAVNKHLLPIYNKPMILYGIEALTDSGIKNVIISISYVNPYGFMELLRDGSEYGIHISYVYQREVKGIAWAINEAQPWIGDESFIVYLGDNIFVDGIKPHVKAFIEEPTKPLVLLKRVEDIDEARRYGVAVFENGSENPESGHKPEILQLVEKPSEPPSPYVLLGLYFLTPEFFKIFPELKPSERGEYEITDALNHLMPVNYEIYRGVWFDAGTFQSIHKASEYVIGCQ